MKCRSDTQKKRRPPITGEPPFPGFIKFFYTADLCQGTCSLVIHYGLYFLIAEDWFVSLKHKDDAVLTYAHCPSVIIQFAGNLPARCFRVTFGRATLRRITVHNLPTWPIAVFSHRWTSNFQILKFQGKNLSDSNPELKHATSNGYIERLLKPPGHRSNRPPANKPYCISIYMTKDIQKVNR